MARYIIRIARRAGIILLFAFAIVLGLASGVFFAYAGDLPQDFCAGRLRAEHHHARLRRRAARSSASSRFSGARSSPYEAISPKLKQAILAAEDADVRAALRPQHPPHRRHARQGHRRTADGGRARARSRSSSPASCSSPTRKPGSARSRKRSSPSRSRSATRRTRSSPSTATRCTSGHGVYGVRGGVAALLRQGGQGSHPRGSGADCRHSAGQRPAEPVREHGGARCGGATTRSRAWRMSATSLRKKRRPPEPEADRDCGASPR